MTKPLALLCAEELEQQHPHEAAAELRRLHALNAELLKFIEDFVADYDASEAFRKSAYIADAKALIAKATGSAL